MRRGGEFDLAGSSRGHISGSFAGTSLHDVGTITDGSTNAARSRTANQRASLPHLPPWPVARAWLNSHGTGVHLSVVTPLESPCALTACEFLPSFGLAKPLAAMFGVRLGTLTIQLLHSSAVGEIAHVSLLNAPHRSFVLSKTEKEKTERLTLLARAQMVPEQLFGPVPWAAMNCYDVAYAPGSKEGATSCGSFCLLQCLSSPGHTRRWHRMSPLRILSAVGA
jgi:hypothetical protein